jgi:O-antigen ligase
MISRNESRSNRGSIREQMESVSNIQTDISNLERINRWKCALRMFADRPVTGFGPGSYQFIYYQYQIRKDMTRISTVHGEKGNAHSEYLGHMAEAGLPGLLLFLATLLIAVQSALRVIYRSAYRHWRTTALVVVICLLTFYVHAIFNAFLETDELGALYYAGLAAIMALDLGSNRLGAAETT